MGCNQEARPDTIARFLSTKSSRRKRFFFSRRRDTLFRKTKKGSQDFVGFRSQPAGYPAITPLASRRKRFFSSRRRDTLFRKTKKGSRDFVGFRSQPAGYPAMNLLVMLLHNLTYTKHLDPTFDRFWRKREKIRKNNAETRMKSLKILDF